MKLRLGHSPDADDAFMFYAISNDKVSAPNLTFTEELHDIETLNKMAHDGLLDVTAISAAAYPDLKSKYLLLSHGASCGEGYGPVVIRKSGDQDADPTKHTVAIPGEKTTAALTLRIKYPGVSTEVVPFSEIMDAVSEGRFRCGVIIHEGQLTYQDKGFEAVCDLGLWWQEKHGVPLPLGLNAIRRDLPAEILKEADEVLEKSIQYALDHREEALDFAMKYASGIPRELADRFVGMYVNGLTRSLGEQGRQGLDLLYKEAMQAGLLPKGSEPEFVRDSLKT